MVERCLRGDEQAFVELMGRYKRPILNFAYRFLGNADAADDVAQEVFIKAYRGLPRYASGRGAQLSTWLFQIARNAAIDALRRRQRNPAHPGAGDQAGVLEATAGRSSVPAEVSSRELAGQIEAAVTSLPEEQRTAIVLAEYEGLSAAGIAAVMGTTRRSVEGHLYRARQTLRQTLRAALE